MAMVILAIVIARHAPRLMRERIGRLRVRPSDGPACWRRGCGFTLIELLVVLAALALLLSLAAPRYVEHVDRAREAVLHSNLAALRDALDRYQNDKGRYPEKLQDLVDARYLRAVPLDPYTERADTWRLLPPGAFPNAAGTPAPPAQPQGVPGQIADVRSGALGKARDGTDYGSW